MRVSAALVLSVARFAQAQPPTLAGVLERAASYVAEFERQLTAMAADDLLPPVEMHERYRARGPNQTMIEASARYGPFRLVPF